MTDRLVAVLRHALPGVAVTGAVRLGHGHVRECWRTRWGSTPVVVKLGRGATGPDRLRREIAAIGLAGCGGVPTPPVVWSCPASPVTNGSVLVTGFLPGVDGLDFVAAAGRPAAERMLYSLGALVSRLHTVTATTAWRDTLWPYAATHLDRLRRTGLVTDTAARRIGRAVESGLGRVGDRVRPALTHRDLHLPNVLVEDGVATALLDFESARLWDPVADLYKLRRWVFEGPGDEECFLAGYGGLGRLGDGVADRYRLCALVEAVSLLNYWHDRRDATRAAEVLAEIGELS